MSFLARLKKTFAVRAKALLGGAISWAGVDWGGYLSQVECSDAPRDAGAWLRVFKRNGQVMAPINRIAEDVAAVPFHLMRKIDGPVGMDGKQPAEQVVEVTASETERRLLRLMKRPSPRMTGSRWRWLIMVYLKTVGYAPLLIEWEQIGRGERYPKALHPVVPSRVMSIPTADKPYFRFRGAKGRTTEVAPGDVVWISYPDVEDPYGMGAGPCQAVDDEVSQLHWSGVWNNNYFRQGARPGSVVSVEGMTPDTKKQLEAEWQSKYTGVHNAHKTLFLPHKVSVAPFGPAHKDLDFVAGEQSRGDRIRFVFGMPPELLGDVRNSNRATIQGAEKVHQTGNLAPACLFLEESWNDWIVPLFGDESLFVSYSNPVRQTEEMQHQALTDGLEHGAVTRDEWRMGHKMDPWGPPHGNQYGQPLNTTWVSLDGPPLLPQHDTEEEVARAFAAAAKALHRGGEGYRHGGQARNGSPRFVG